MDFDITICFVKYILKGEFSFSVDVKIAQKVLE